MAAFYNSLNVFVNQHKQIISLQLIWKALRVGHQLLHTTLVGRKVIVEGETGFAVSLNDVSAIVEKINFIINNKEKFDRHKVSSVSDFRC